MLLKIINIVSIAIHPITHNLLHPDVILTVTTILFHPAVNILSHWSELQAETEYKYCSKFRMFLNFMTTAVPLGSGMPCKSQACQSNR